MDGTATKIGSDSDRSPKPAESGRNLDVNPYREEEMARLMPVAGFVLALAGTVGLWATHAAANDELLKLQEDPKQWVMPLGNYASTRYSGLDQINRDNVGD